MCRYELYHHGVKGQKWGVRNGPPYPIEDKVLKKGTKLNSVSSVYRNSNEYKRTGRWMYTYNPDDEWDSKVYKGPFAGYLITGRGATFLAEHQYEVVKDLKMPTKKERVDEFISLYAKNKKVVVSDLTEVQERIRKKNMRSEEARNVNLKDLKTRKDYEAAYEVLNHAMEYSYRYRTTRQYSKIMSKKYDAMVDDNNQGIYNDAHDPVIIFKPYKMLNTIGPVKYATLEEICDNYDYVDKKLRAEGKQVYL